MKRNTSGKRAFAASVQPARPGNFPVELEGHSVLGKWFKLRGEAARVSRRGATLISEAVATIVSAIVGYASIWFLLRYLRTHSTGIFIGYRLFLGAAILLMLAGGFIQPV